MIDYKNIKSIVFVCLGNICRSPMCESIMTYLLKLNNMSYIKVYSMGTSMEEYGNPVHRGTVNKLYQQKIPLVPHRAVQITNNDYDKFDLIIGLDFSNIRNLLRIFNGDKQDKVRLLLSFTGDDRAVADPWWDGDFDTAFNDCYKGCVALLNFLKTGTVQ